MRIDSPLMTNTVATGSFSGSFSGDGTGLTGVGGNPGGSNTQVQFNDNGSFGGSSNLTFDGTNLTVGGKVTATEIVTNVVSQSISFATGSNRFGDEISDTHTFTGSLLVTGSLNLSSVVNAGTDTDKFLVLDSDGNVDFRTGANVLSDIGATTCTGTVTGTGATDRLAIWNGTSALNSYSGLTFDDSTLYVNTQAGICVAGGAIINDSEEDANVSIRGFGGSSCILMGSSEDGGICMGPTVIIGGSQNFNHLGINQNSSILGGNCNKITANCTTIAGGTLNTGSGACGFIGGGCVNYSTSTFSFIGGGCGNQIRCCGSSGATGTATCSVIAGGNCNIIAGGGYGTIAGGWNNFVSSSVASFIGAGAQNCIAGGYSGNDFSSGHTIAGGYRNKICYPAHHQSFIGGGNCNEISCNQSVIAGGRQNCTTGGYASVIGGGCLNTVNGEFSGILGGCNNTVSHDHSFIIGCNLTSTAACYTFMNNACVAGTTRTTTLVETSARKYKECILPLEDQIENIKKLEPVEFQWKKDKTKDIGFIAEDVLKVYPDLIAYEEDGEINGIQYSKLTTVLVKALQQQQEQINELEQEIKVLKQK